MIYRTHWLDYLRPVTILVANLAILGLVAYALIWARGGFINEISGGLGVDTTISGRIVVGLGIIALAVALFSTSKSFVGVLYETQYAVRVFEDKVEYSWGLFPWQKRYLFWNADQIYAVGHQWTPPFIGWLFRCGTVTLTTKDGIASQTSFYNMSNSQSLAHEIMSVSGILGE